MNTRNYFDMASFSKFMTFLRHHTSLSPTTRNGSSTNRRGSHTAQIVFPIMNSGCSTTCRTPTWQFALCLVHHPPVGNSSAWDQ